MRMKNLNAIIYALRCGALFKQQRPRPRMHGLMMPVIAELKSAMTSFLLHSGRPDSLYSYGLIHLIALEDTGEALLESPVTTISSMTVTALEPGGNNYPFPESPGDWPIRSYAKHAAFRDFHFKTMVGLWIFGDPRRAERVELATHRALRDRRAPVPSSSREVYCLKDLEHVQQTLRQTLKLSNQQLLQLQSEDLKDARRNKRSTDARGFTGLLSLQL